MDQEIETKLALYDSRQLTNSLADVFLQFFVLLLGDYRRFFSDKSRFEREEFIESQNTWELKQVRLLSLSSSLPFCFFLSHTLVVFGSNGIHLQVYGVVLWITDVRDVYQRQAEELLHKQ